MRKALAAFAVCAALSIVAAKIANYFYTKQKLSVCSLKDSCYVPPPALYSIFNRVSSGFLILTMVCFVVIMVLAIRQLYMIFIHQP